MLLLVVGYCHIKMSKIASLLNITCCHHLTLKDKVGYKESNPRILRYVYLVQCLQGARNRLVIGSSRSIILYLVRI